MRSALVNVTASFKLPHEFANITHKGYSKETVHHAGNLENFKRYSCSWKTDQKAKAHYDWSVIPPGFELSFASEPNNKTKYQNNSEQQSEENEENYYFGNYALSQFERKIAKANIKKTSVVRR